MSEGREQFPSFARDVPMSGYRWWYVDATSDDGKDHLVVIAFVGSVFSPFYKKAVSRGPADPMDYCAINVGLYSHRELHARWVMTESRRQDVERSADHFAVSNSALDFNGQSLIIDIDEWAAPVPLKVRGRVTVHPVAVTSKEYTLEASGRHFWWPFSPSARVEVAFEQPNVKWSGHGYVDTNRGDEPLHEGFDTWHWSRTHYSSHTHIAYNAVDRSGAPSELALRISDTGETEVEPVHERQPMPSTTIWRAPRSAHLPRPVKVVKTLEDTPFYARSIISSQDRSHPATMHESLSLKRFRASWVTRLIPFRMRFPLRR